MKQDIYAPDIVAALKRSNRFEFQDSGNYLTRGICPSCGKRELFISKDKPFVLKCNRLNQCGYQESVREALPELFEDLSKRYPPTERNSHATADAYLGFNRGFDLSKIRGWYEQATHQIPNTQIFYPTVRFYLDAYNTRYWERFIEGANKDGKKAHFGGKRKPDNTLYRGDVWTPPGFTLDRLEECYIVEGIFHAIALYLAGINAVAAFSADHFPSAFIEAHKKKGVKWVLALDSDHAGRSGMRKHHKLLKQMGELASVCLLPRGKDWDDLWREGAITPGNLSKWKHNGRLFLAESVEEKAYYMYLKRERDSFILDFENALFEAKIGAEFGQRFEPLVEHEREEIWNAKAEAKKKAEAARAESPQPENEEAAGQAEPQAEPAGTAAPSGPAEEPGPEDAIREAEKAIAEQDGAEQNDARTAALLSREGRDLFRQFVQVTQISNVNPRFLYMERNEILGEQYYVFSIDYANGQGQDIIELEGTAITTPDAFHKALLNKSRGGTFDGDVRHLKTLRSGWLDSRMLTVTAVPYVGYDKGIGAYIFQRHAWHNGRRQKVNPQGYFTVNRTGVKSSLQGVSLNTEGRFDPSWIEPFAKAFSWQGMATLAFWLGSLFVQQIRDRHKTFPFLELTGEPGAGKSTILEFLWKCVGRDDYEGFDLLKSSPAGRRRAFSQVSNLPVVIIESDRDNGDKDAKQKQFGFDEVKPFYNGRGTGTLGVAKRGNETDESLFQASLLISQNAEVDGSEALLQRIVHCHADKRHHQPGTREIARWFERQTSDSVGGFLGEALSRERQILEAYERAFERREKEYSDTGLKNERIIKNHAQIAACADALRLIFPGMTEKTTDGIAAYLQERAVIRERRVQADHPMLETFWETYDYINSRSPKGVDQLNHSQSPETTIAVNLNHYRETCVDYGQPYPDMALLKKLLPYTRRHKFVEANKAVASRVESSKTVKCWIFERKGAA